MKLSLDFIDILQLLFILLKVFGVIDWSWWLVFAPLLGEIAVSLIVLIGAMVISMLLDDL